MINRVVSATIHVSDQDKALDFYVNSLGFAKKRDEQFGLSFRSFLGGQIAVFVGRSQQV